GGASAEEAAAGFPVHGETSVARFAIDARDDRLTMETVLPNAQLRVSREIVVEGHTVRVRERVENLGASDGPVGWTQHVTLGPPFLVKGTTEFRITADRSAVYPGSFGPADSLEAGAEFRWPNAPRAGGGTIDMRRYSAAVVSSAYTAHRMDPALADASFVA